MHAGIETEETIGLILSVRSQHKRARVARRRFSFDSRRQMYRNENGTQTIK